MINLDIEKGDNLFELIFELDRRLQIAQNRSSPLKKMIEAFRYLDEVLVVAHLKQPDVVDTIFLKLVDFFIKCQCNYKRQELSKLISRSIWIKSLKNRREVIKRLCQLWDHCIAFDFETCLQIINFASSCTEIFYHHTEIYAIFYEALNLYHTAAGTVFGSKTIFTCSLYIQKLFEALNSCLKVGNELNYYNLKDLIPIAKFSALIILEVYEKEFIHIRLKDHNENLELKRIMMICSIILGKNIRLDSLPDELSTLLIYFLPNK